MQFITNCVSLLLNCVDCHSKQTLVELYINLHPHIYMFRSISRSQLYYRSKQSRSSRTMATTGDHMLVD